MRELRDEIKKKSGITSLTDSEGLQKLHFWPNNLNKTSQKICSPCRRMRNQKATRPFIDVHARLHWNNKTTFQSVTITTSWKFNSIYLALESNFSQVRNGMPWPLDGKRRKLRWLQCPQMSVCGQKGTEEPAEGALPKCFQSTTNKHRNSITWWKTNRDKLKSY